MRFAFAVFAVSFCASLGIVDRAASSAAAESPAKRDQPEVRATPRSVQGGAWWSPKQDHESSHRMYRIACVVYERGEDGKDIVLSRPVVATTAHRPAQVQIAQATPLVTGVETMPDGASKPNITLLTTGIKIELKVAPDQAGRVAVDVAIEQSAIESIDVVKLPDGTARQSARMALKTTRVLETAALGKTTTVGLDDKDAAKSIRRAEFTVTEMKPEDFAAKPKPRE